MLLMWIACSANVSNAHRQGAASEEIAENICIRIVTSAAAVDCALEYARPSCLIK